MLKSFCCTIRKNSVSYVYWHELLSTATHGSIDQNIQQIKHCIHTHKQGCSNVTNFKTRYRNFIEDTLLVLGLYISTFAFACLVHVGDNKDRPYTKLKTPKVDFYNSHIFNTSLDL